MKSKFPALNKLTAELKCRNELAKLLGHEAHTGNVATLRAERAARGLPPHATELALDAHGRATTPAPAAVPVVPVVAKPIAPAAPESAASLRLKAQTLTGDKRTAALLEAAKLDERDRQRRAAERALKLRQQHDAMEPGPARIAFRQRHPQLF